MKLIHNRIFPLDQYFLVINELSELSDDSNGTDDDEVNTDEIELIGDPDRELEDIELVYLECTLEPGQLIFIDSSSSLTDDIDTDNSFPAIFIRGENSDDNHFLQILNLETE